MRRSPLGDAVESVAQGVADVVMLTVSGELSEDDVRQVENLEKYLKDGLKCVRNILRELTP